MDVVADRRATLAWERDTLDVALARAWTPYSQPEAPVPHPENDLLQMWLLHADPAHHVAAVLDWWLPSPAATILDCGCGTGSFARYAQPLRPDLRWVLLGHNGPQLRQAHAVAPCVQGDMHTLPLGTASMDGVLLAYVLGYGFAPAVLTEIARVLKPGGACLLYDALAQDDTADSMLCLLGYKCYPFLRLMAYSALAGLQVGRCAFLADRAIPHPQTEQDAGWFAPIAEEIMPFMCRLEKPYA